MLGHVATATSATLQTFRRVPVAAGQVRFPILSALPVAYWVNGDTGLKQTTEEQWNNKFLNIEEMAVIVPVPENVLDDVGDAGDFDLWGEIQPDVEIAIGRTLDSAVFFGTNAPGTFPTDIHTDAAARGFTYAEAGTQAAGGIQDDIDATIALLEPAGFDPSHIVANRTLRSKLRRARSTIGERLTGVNPDITQYLDLDINYPMRGLFPTGAGRVEAFIGDFSEFVVGVRKDISFKLLDQAVIQDNTGAIIYNLPQQDMVAMRFTFRVGWQVSNRIRYDQPNEALRYPVATLTSAT
jgi:HK97 family phage major capsid protein